MNYEAWAQLDHTFPTSEKAVAILNRYREDWYADPSRWPSDEFKYYLVVPKGKEITSLYRKNTPTEDWEWNDDDYLITNTLWPSETAIFYDYDTETWHTATPSPDLPGAWVIQGTGIVVMDAAIFPEELIPQHTGPELTADAIASVVEGALLHAQLLSLLDGALIKARRGQ